MEGTNIRPGLEPAEATLTETDVEMACAELFQRTSGLILASYSAQNIDRMVTLYRAAKRTGRKLVMDLYGASIARATGHESIPRPSEDWPLVRVFVPQWQRVKVKKAEAFERVEAIKPFRIYEKELAASPGAWVVASNRRPLRSSTRGLPRRGARSLVDVARIHEGGVREAIRRVAGETAGSPSASSTRPATHRSRISSDWRSTAPNASSRSTPSAPTSSRTCSPASKFTPTASGGVSERANEAPAEVDGLVSRHGVPALRQADEDRAKTRQAPCRRASDGGIAGPKTRRVERRFLAAGRPRQHPTVPTPHLLVLGKVVRERPACSSQHPERTGRC